MFFFRYYKGGGVSNITLPLSEEMQAKHILIEKEWNDFYHLSKGAINKKSYYKDFILKFDSNRGENEKLLLQEPAAKQKKKKRKNQCIILIYTWLHKSEEWYNLPRNSTKHYLKRTKCKYQNCRVTYDQSYLFISDVVIFHARNIPSTDLLKAISTKFYRPKTQRWIYFTSETPKNTEFGIIPYNGFFNWTMSYKIDSDVFLPYLQYRKLGVRAPRPDPSINYAENKTQIAAWLVGNCDFEFRMDFAQLLDLHTDVYVGGGCRDQFKKRISCTRWCDLNALKHFKFYLSFENGVCTDYITEKYWKYLEMGLVPVVLGGANYDDPRLAIPGSFIDASKFTSVAELGVYLNYLNKNDTAYNEYFKWKQKYTIWHPRKGDWPFESYFLCKICGMLRKKLKNKIYHKLSDFWNEYNDCALPEQKLQSKFIPNDFSFESLQSNSEEEKRIAKAKINKDFDEDFAE